MCNGVGTSVGELGGLYVPHSVLNYLFGITCGGGLLAH